MNKLIKLFTDKNLWIAPPWVIRLLAKKYRQTPDEATDLLAVFRKQVGGRKLILPNVSTFPFPIGDGKKEFKELPLKEFFENEDGIVLVEADDYWNMLIGVGDAWSKPFNARVKHKRRLHAKGRPRTPAEVAEAAARKAAAKARKRARAERDRALRKKMRGDNPAHRARQRV